MSLIKLISVFLFLSLPTFSFGHSHMPGHHHDSTIELKNSGLNMSISIEVTKDSMKGYNLFLVTNDFTFTPRAAGQSAVIGQGHAHLYVNGVKVTRLYGNSFYLGNLKNGHNHVKVTLNSDDHRAYVYKDTSVSASAMVIVDESGSEHKH